MNDFTADIIYNKIIVKYVSMNRTEFGKLTFLGYCACRGHCTKKETLKKIRNLLNTQRSLINGRDKIPAHQPRSLAVDVVDNLMTILFSVQAGFTHLSLYKYIPKPNPPE